MPCKRHDIILIDGCAKNCAKKQNKILVHKMDYPINNPIRLLNLIEKFIKKNPQNERFRG